MLLNTLILINLLYICSTLCTSNEDFTIWGPGLKPDKITMPARYFFIQHSLRNESCSHIQPDVKVVGTNSMQRACRIWTNILNSTDCFYIVRYKLYETCRDLTISIKVNDEHIAQSPYVFSNKVYLDSCDCNHKPNIEDWLSEWECGDVPEQILKDLSIFDKLDFDTLRIKIIDEYNNPTATSLCHYVIKNNVVYRKCYGKYVGFKMFVDNILLSLSRKMILPDLEFFFNLGDWPLVKRQLWPIFSWCGSHDSYDIVVPTYDITESSLENMGRVMLDMLSVQGNAKIPWEKRHPKAFWRGRDSNRHRLNLIDLSRDHPSLFNASLTNFFFFRAEEAKYGPKSEHVSFFSFFDYKYQLSIDGTVAAYRFPYLLAGGSLLIKQASKYYEHFYNSLVPNVHYVLVKEDLSDLIDKLMWAVENDKKSQKIAQNGISFARNNLLPKNIYCYHAMLLNEFSKKIISSIEILDMEIVESQQEKTYCDCPVNNKDEL